MVRASGHSNVLRRIFVLACVLAFVISCGVIAHNLDLAPPLTAAGLAFVSVMAVYLLWRQTLLVRNIRELNSAIANLQQPAPADTEFFITDAVEQTLSTRVGKVLEESEALSMMQVRLSGLEAGFGRTEYRLAALEARQTTETSATPADSGPAAMAPSHPPASPSTENAPQTEYMRQAVADDNLNMHLQPVVELPERQPVWFEGFMRLRGEDGYLVPERRFRKIAETAGVLPLIEYKVLAASLRLLGELEAFNRPLGILCSLSPATLADREICERIINTLDARRQTAGALVLQMIQEDYDQLDSALMQRFHTMHRDGVALGLKDVIHLDIDLELLERNGFKTIKAPVGALLRSNEEGQGPVPQLVLSAESLGITLIGDGVEFESEALALIERDVACGQGSHFAPPRPVKPDLLQTGEASSQAA